jgi:hypothetical protein
MSFFHQDFIKHDSIMNQYLVRHTTLVLAATSKEEGEEVADYDREYFDVQIGLAADALRRQVEVEPQFVNVRVVDTNELLVEKHNRTFCRKDYEENHDALFEYLLSILDFARWQRVDVAGVDSATNEQYNIKGWEKIFPYEHASNRIEVAQSVFEFFFANIMLKITDADTQLQAFIDLHPDRLPGVVWTFTMQVVISGPFMKNFPCNHSVNINIIIFFFRRSKRQRNFSLFYFASQES